MKKSVVACLVQLRSGMTPPWHESLGAVLEVLLILTVFALGSLLRRAHVVPEMTRKSAHFLTALALLPLPNLVHSLAGTVVLATFLSTVIFVLRRGRRLAFLDDVQRSGLSEYAFVAGAVFLYAVAAGQPFLYRTPLLVLGVSDALAAMVGKRWGEHPYRVGSSTRSWEGTLVFAASAWAIIVISRTASGPFSISIWAFALLSAVLVASVEALSVKGIDNFTIPAATFVCLRWLA